LDVDRRLGAVLHDAIRTFGTVASWKALVESMDAVRMRSFMVDVCGGRRWGRHSCLSTYLLRYCLTLRLPFLSTCQHHLHQGKEV
jgi:hypothetical protein